MPPAPRRMLVSVEEGESHVQEVAPRVEGRGRVMSREGTCGADESISGSEALD